MNMNFRKLSEKEMCLVNGGVQIAIPAPLPVNLVAEWDRGETVIAAKVNYDPVTRVVESLEDMSEPHGYRLDKASIYLSDGSMWPVVWFMDHYVAAEQFIVRFTDENNALDVPELTMGQYYLCVVENDDLVLISSLYGYHVGCYCAERFEITSTAELIKNYPSFIVDHPELVSGFPAKTLKSRQETTLRQSLTAVKNMSLNLQIAQEIALKTSGFHSEVERNSYISEQSSAIIQLVTNMLEGDDLRSLERDHETIQLLTENGYYGEVSFMGTDESYCTLHSGWDTQGVGTHVRGIGSDIHESIRNAYANRKKPAAIVFNPGRNFGVRHES